MLNVRYSTRFKRDFKLCVKRHWNMELLQQVIDTLKIPDTLPQKNLDHSLSGDHSGHRECYVAPDWLLIYRQDEEELLLYRTGTHADLFGI
ncbi:MAG: type II toxin-antitoxin system YafQ family toxin [Lawsonibacter sp.]|nr:type II toxin-antitoxin system YafQ family toxin [Lawsonibacter sp.]MCI9294624.1 type II toxin-antitoxin system YafQ family toxin [Lawsonibacter sp.]